MNLQLSLKRQWFEMTDCGEKKEDYREITPYWANRLFKKKQQGIGSVAYWKGFLRQRGQEGIRHFVFYGFKNQESIDYVLSEFEFKPFTTTTITLGCPKDGDIERTRHYIHAGIEIRTGNPEWGAEPDKLYFVIKHGVKL